MPHGATTSSRTAERRIQNDVRADKRFVGAAAIAAEVRRRLQQRKASLSGSANNRALVPRGGNVQHQRQGGNISVPRCLSGHSNPVNGILRDSVGHYLFSQFALYATGCPRALQPPAMRGYANFPVRVPFVSTLQIPAGHSLVVTPTPYTHRPMAYWIGPATGGVGWTTGTHPAGHLSGSNTSSGVTIGALAYRATSNPFVDYSGHGGPLQCNFQFMGGGTQVTVNTAWDGLCVIHGSGADENPRLHGRRKQPFDNAGKVDSANEWMGFLNYPHSFNGPEDVMSQIAPVVVHGNSTKYMHVPSSPILPGWSRFNDALADAEDTWATTNQYQAGKISTGGLSCGQSVIAVQNQGSSPALVTFSGVHWYRLSPHQDSPAWGMTQQSGSHIVNAPNVGYGGFVGIGDSPAKANVDSLGKAVTYLDKLSTHDPSTIAAVSSISKSLIPRLPAVPDISQSGLTAQPPSDKTNGISNLFSTLTEVYKGADDFIKTTSGGEHGVVSAVKAISAFAM